MAKKRKNKHLLLSSLIHAAIVLCFLPILYSDTVTPTATNQTRVDDVSIQGMEKRVQKLPPADQPAAENGDTASGTTETTLAPGVMNAYLSDVATRIHHVKRYPKEAKIKGEEGLVEISIAVAADGKIANSSVEKPSPYESLNQEALEAVKRLGSLPPPPSGAILIHIPIQFQLL